MSKHYYPHAIAAAALAVSASVAFKWPVPVLIISATLLLSLFLYSMHLTARKEEYSVTPRKRLLFTLRHIDKEVLSATKKDINLHQYNLNHIEKALVSIPGDMTTSYMQQIDDVCRLYLDLFAALDTISHDQSLLPIFHDDDERQKDLRLKSVLLLGAIERIKGDYEKTQCHQTKYEDDYGAALAQMGDLDFLNDQIEKIINSQQEDQ